MFHYLWTLAELLDLYLKNINYQLVRLCRDSSLEICFKFLKSIIFSNTEYLHTNCSFFIENKVTLENTSNYRG